MQLIHQHSLKSGGWPGFEPGSLTFMASALTSKLEEVSDVTDDNLGDTEPTGDILEKIEVVTDNIEDTQSPKVACKYYQKNLCKFGISGKGCKFNHLKPCSRLLKRGICQRDGKCQAFHPPMCKFSLQKRLCTNPSCEYMHVKGTKRQNKDEHSKYSNVKSAGKSSNTKHNSKNTSNKSIPNSTANNERLTVKSSTVPKTGNKSRPFLGLGQSSPPQPPPLYQEVVGTGSGEEMKIMMNLMNQILQVLHTGTQRQVQQAQAVQLQAHPLLAQPPGRHPMLFQTR